MRLSKLLYADRNSRLVCSIVMRGQKDQGAIPLLSESPWDRQERGFPY